MDAKLKERLEEVLMKAGGQTWSSFIDMFEDTEFPSFLTDQERGIFNQIRQDPNVFHSYRHIFIDIVSKYLSWKVYRDTKLRDVNIKLKKVSEEIDSYADELKTIRNTAKYIGGATVLVEYSKAFKDTSEVHKLAAVKQQRYYTVSLGIFVISVSVAFFVSLIDVPLVKRVLADDLNLVKFGTGFLVMKVMVLFFFYQIALFYKRNYNAEKHLEEVYRHRSDVLQSLHAVYNAIKDEKERDKILSMGVLFAYERGETGYITTKEGAGSNDNLIEGIFSKILNK